VRAIIETGGKQYRVVPGQRLLVERLHGEPGDQVELDRVLLLEDEGQVVVGSPTIDGAKVLAHVLGQPRGPKLTVFKFKAKVRYRRKTGHRQEQTELRIGDIVRAEQAAPTRRRRAAPAASAEAAPEEEETSGS